MGDSSMDRQWRRWILAGVALFILIAPGGRYLTIIPGGRWIIVSVGFLLGFSLGGWWSKIREGEEALLRGRLVRGEIRLTEYRILCRELGIGKKKPTSLKNEKDFSTIDGTYPND